MEEFVLWGIVQEVLNLILIQIHHIIKTRFLRIQIRFSDDLIQDNQLLVLKKWIELSKEIFTHQTFTLIAYIKRDFLKSDEN